MRQWLSQLSLWSALMLVGCGGETSPDRADAGAPDASAPGAASRQSGSGKAAKATFERPSHGSRVFLRCRSCHLLEESKVHLTGPNLQGVFGATAGEKEGYVFSEAFVRSSVVWSAETLDAFLQEPNDYIPGTKMAFAGLPNKEDRVALIEFLEEKTQ